MGALQKLIAQILARSRGINASQRVALVLGGALVAVSLISLLVWAAKPEMVPLLEQDFQGAELAEVRSGLDAMGQKYEIRGNRVYVPPASRSALLAQLQQQDQLPSNTSAGFAALVKQSDPWISQEESNRRWTWALQTELEEILRQFQGVREARVILNFNMQQRTFTRQAPANSASVTLLMKSGDEVPRSLALAAARLVSGAVAGLKARDVQVVDTSGKVALDWDVERDPTSTLHQQRFKFEQHYTELIRRLIPDPRALVSVAVELVSTSSSSKTETPLKGVPVSEESTSDETQRTHRSEQPGVQPNVGLAAGSGGGDESRRQDTSKSEFRPGVSLKTEDTPPGDVRLVTAAIRLSSSYLEGVCRRTHPDVQVPTDTQLEETFQVERQRLASQVKRLVKPQVEENLDIQWYWDSSMTVAEAGSAGALDHALELGRRYGTQGGLGLLALVALGMMLRLARKSGGEESLGIELGLPEEAIEAAKLAAADVSSAATRVVHRSSAGRQAPGGGSVLMVEGTPAASPEATSVSEVAQATATEGMLVAQEVDPATVQTRKMLDQVAEMVRTDPDTVSTLLDQWVQKNEQYREKES